LIGKESVAAWKLLGGRGGMVGEVDCLLVDEHFFEPKGHERRE